MGALVSRVNQAEYTAGILFTTLPHRDLFRVSDKAFLYSLRMRLGLPQVPNLSSCPHHREKHNAKMGVNAYTIDPAHAFSCPTILRCNGNATIRHDALARVIQLLCDRELPTSTEWQQFVKQLMSMSSTAVTKIPALLPVDPLPSDKVPDKTPLRRSASAASAPAAEARTQGVEEEEEEELTADQILYGPNPLSPEERGREIIGDLTIFSCHFLLPLLLDFFIFSPCNQTELKAWKAMLGGGKHDFLTDMPVFKRMKQMEQIKIKKYADFVRDLIPGTGPAADLFAAAGFVFVPAVTTIFGNISPAFDALLRKLAELPSKGFDPALHPVRDCFCFTPEQSTQATLRRYRCLIATANCRALARTFDLNTVFRRPSRGWGGLVVVGKGRGGRGGRGWGFGRG